MMAFIRSLACVLAVGCVLRGSAPVCEVPRQTLLAFQSPQLHFEPRPTHTATPAPTHTPTYRPTSTPRPAFTSTATPTPCWWDSGDWRNFAAHIVASEARGVPEADIVVACTLIHDIECGWDPWQLRNRWFGWGPPDVADRVAVDFALNGGCWNIPVYRYVGNLRDLELWRRRGMVTDDAVVDVYGGRVVGVR